MLPEEDKEMMRQGFDTQLSEEEIERLYSFAEKNAMEELAGVDIEELKRRERLFPIYKPDVKLSLDALLACAFARSQKMMPIRSYSSSKHRRVTIFKAASLLVAALLPA